MALVQICDFGELNGIKTYRINGDRHNLEKIIEECRKEDDNCFHGTPELKYVYKGSWTLLLRIKVAMKVGDVVD